jgi:hypothetical protein
VGGVFFHFIQSSPAGYKEEECLVQVEVDVAGEVAVDELVKLLLVDLDSGIVAY